jgi:hypothetical protein
MSDWHLRSHWDDNGRQTGGLIEYVWLFSIVGVFVLLLACINFMNLSTARSEKRAKGSWHPQGNWLLALTISWPVLL